jgi:hypothetical protein
MIFTPLSGFYSVETEEGREQHRKSELDHSIPILKSLVPVDLSNSNSTVQWLFERAGEAALRQWLTERAITLAAVMSNMPQDYDPITVTDEFMNECGLPIAAAAGNLLVVRWLVETCHTTRNASLAVQLACSQGRCDVLKYLLQLAHVKLLPQTIRTGVYQACEHKNFRAASILADEIVMRQLIDRNSAIDLEAFVREQTNEFARVKEPVIEVARAKELATEESLEIRAAD